MCIPYGPGAGRGPVRGLGDVIIMGYARSGKGTNAFRRCRDFDSFRALKQDWQEYNVQLGLK